MKDINEVAYFSLLVLVRVLNKVEECGRTLPWKRRILVDQGRKVKQANAIDCEGKR